MSKLNNITLAKLVKSNGLIGPLKFYCNTLLEIIYLTQKLLIIRINLLKNIKS